MTTSTISQNGQTTIPSKVREFLHVGPNDKLVYQFEGGRVFLEAVRSSTEALYGCLKAGRKLLSKDELKAARKAHCARKLNKEREAERCFAGWRGVAADEPREGKKRAGRA